MALINAIDTTFALSTGQVLVANGSKSATTVGLGNGQLLIGTGASTAPAATTLTAGTGINITNAAGSITIAATAIGTTWNTVASSTTMSAGQAYVVTNTSTVTLPTPAVGNVIQVIGTAGGYTIQAPASVSIQVGSVVGAAAGSAVSQYPGDALVLVGTSATQWTALSTQGVFNVT